MGKLKAREVTICPEKFKSLNILSKIRSVIIYRTLKYSRYGLWRTSVSYRKPHFCKVYLLSSVTNICIKQIMHSFCVYIQSLTTASGSRLFGSVVRALDF